MISSFLHYFVSQAMGDNIGLLQVRCCPAVLVLCIREAFVPLTDRISSFSTETKISSMVFQGFLYSLKRAIWSSTCVGSITVLSGC